MLEPIPFAGYIEIDINNKPIAYFVKDKQGWWAETDKETGIPLYTNQAKFKELTDAEIMESCHAYHYTYNPDYLGFAREILKKAQEK